MAKMRAVQVKEPKGAFEQIQKEIPEPGAGQVRVKVQACGVCRGDSAVKDGAPIAGEIQYPRIPGHEVIGVVDKLGPGVTGVSTGQRVGVGWPAGISYDGGFAEYLVTAAEELIETPEELESARAAPLLCAGATTYDALRHSGAAPGDLVAVVGIGGLGHLGVQYAKRLGFKTVALSRGEKKKELALELGAERYIDMEKEDAARELEGMGGAKVILLTAPDSKAVPVLLEGLAPGGKLVIVAGLAEPLELMGGQLLHGNRSIQGWIPGGVPAKEETLRFSLENKVAPLIETFALDEVEEAYRRMMNTDVRFRAVLVLDEDER